MTEAMNEAMNRAANRRAAARTLTAALACFALSAFAAGPLAGPAHAAEALTLMFGQKTATASEARPYFLPKHLGFFKDEGIEVTLQPTDGATQSMQLLAAGKGDAAMSAPPAVLLARSNNAKVRAIYNSVQNHGAALAVMADGPIKDAKDLKGKKIGVLSIGASRTLDGKAMIKAAGLDPEKDIEWLPVGFGVQAALALRRGDVQALALWDLTYADMESNGFKLRYFTFPFQKDIFGYVYVSTEDKLKERREAIIKLLRSGAKAGVFQRENVEAAACIFVMESGRWDVAPDKRKVYDTALAAMKMDVERARIGSDHIGAFPPHGWEKVRDYYYGLGVIKSKLPPEDYYVADAAFNAEVNKFDMDKVIAMARAYPNKCKSSL